MMYYSLQILLYITLLFPVFLEAKKCPSTDHESLLLPGRNYSYSFYGEVVVQTPGNEKSQISIRCDVAVSHVKDCQYGLHLLSCFSNEGSSKEDQPLKLSRYPVLFSLANGEIDDIYSNEEEPLHALNVKRGIISAFVFKLSRTKLASEEVTTDVHGTCPSTSAPLLNALGSVRTSRNLLMCNRTDKKESMFFSNQNAINSIIECDYDINPSERRLNQINCTEKHTSDTIQATVYFRMTHKSSPLPDTISDYSSTIRKVRIQFEHEKQVPNDPEDFEQVALKMLSQLVEHTSDGINLSTISEFSNLVKWLRSSRNMTVLLKEILSTNYLGDDSLSRKEILMSYFTAALMHCSSAPCIEAISSIVKSGEFSPPNSLYYSWSKMLTPDTAIPRLIKNICHHTNSEVCWTTLGSLVQRIYLKQPDHGETKKQILEIVKYLEKNIKILCFSAESDPVSLRRNLEVIKSMGNAYAFLSSEGYKELMECFLKSYVPDDIKILILEVLNGVNSYHGETFSKEIYKEYLHILLNSTLSTNVRRVVYDQVIRNPENDELANTILMILKTEEDLHLKSHIAKNLKALFSNTTIDKDEKRFVTVINDLLSIEEISLDRLIHEFEAKIASEGSFAALDLWNLQEAIKFCFKLLKAKLSESSSESFDWNETIFKQLILNIGRIFQYSDESSKRFEVFVFLLQELVKNFHSETPSSENISGILEDIMKQFYAHLKPSQEYRFAEAVLNNIKILEELYEKNKYESKTFFNRISNFIGTTWYYFASGKIFRIPGRMLELHSLLKDLEKGVHYNATRMIRVLEDQQQVPTMIGLPLRWDRSAVAAISLRTGLKLEMKPENYDFSLEGTFQPSAALTYLNEVVIGFPSSTQIGVQANRSAFASTKMRAKLLYSEQRKTLRFGKPSRSENILQLFDTYRLKRHEARPDDQRKDTLLNCRENLLSFLLGMQFCVLQYHPDLLDTNDWTWQAFLQPSDETIESYDIVFIQSRGTKPEELIIKPNTTGKIKRKEILVIFTNKASNGVTQFQVTIPAMPYFEFYAINFNREGNFKTVMNLAFYDGQHYELFYKVDLIKHHSDVKDSKMEERSFYFRSPFNNYSVTLKNLGKETTEKTDIMLFIESSGDKWLHGILPKSFWHTDTTAWLQIQIFWDTDATSNPRQTFIIIEDPKTTTKLSRGILELNGGERQYLCASKRQISEGKLLGTAYFTYDWSLQSDDSNQIQAQIFNLTIAEKSWAIGVRNERKLGKVLYEVSFKRAATISQVEEVCDYIASPSAVSPKIYYMEQPELKLVADIGMQMIDSQELAQKYSSVKAEELEGLWNHLITVNSSLQYPLVFGPESVKVEGYMVASGRSSSVTRSQNNFEIESSYHNLQLAVQSVYISEEDFVSLSYNSRLTYLPTDQKAFHSIQFWLSTPAEKCLEAEFNHTILSRVFDLSTIVTYKCKPNQTELHDLRLNMRTNSSHWNMLNLTINQLVEDHTPEYTLETCNVTHPLLLINVTADWVGEERDHKKRALFTCRQENCQSTELLIQALHSGKMAADLIIPEDSKRKKFSLERTISSDAKIQNWKIAFSNDEEIDSECLHLKGEILNEDYQIWNFKLAPGTCSEVFSFLRQGYQNVLQQVATIARDAQHPVNKMFHSSLEMTLSEYFESLANQGIYVLQNTWKNLKETAQNMKVFFNDPITLLLNVITNLNTYFATKNDSILTSFGFSNLSVYFYNVRETIYQLLKPKEKTLEWELVTNQIVKVESFKQWPSISFKETHGNLSEQEQKPISYPKTNNIALIIGFTHVFRFDEHLLPIPDSPECVFLLAREAREHAFTILIGQGRIHVMFPEMTVSINEENDIVIDGSEVPSPLPDEFSNGNIRVMIDEDSIEVQSPDIAISCSMERFIHVCVLEMDALQNVEVFGLLGSTDGSNAYTYSVLESKTTSEVLEFVSQYEVSGKTECKNFMKEFKLSFETSADGCLIQLLKECQLKWNILEQFVEMCKSGFSGDAVSGYAALCDYEIFHNSTNLKGNVEYREQKAKIVFIIQEHRSLKKAGNFFEGVEQLLSVLKSQFPTKDFSDVLFSLVGFGGQYSPEYYVYAKQKTSLILRGALERLEFDGDEDVDIPNILEINSEALDNDLSDPKIFILLTTKETMSRSKDSVSEVKQSLKNEILYAFVPCSSDSKDEFECSSQREENQDSLCKLYTKGSVFCLLREHSNAMFGKFAENRWSVTTEQPVTCSANRNWWERTKVCPWI